MTTLTLANPPSKHSRLAPVLAVVTTVFLLLGPAFYNRFPLIFPDTDDYIKVTYGHFWTLDRSGFYGLMFKPFLPAMTGLSGVWLAVTLQATIVAWILIMTIRRLCPPLPIWLALLIIFVTCIVTSLPWHAAQLIPDSFTGVLILLGWNASSRNAAETGTGLLWLGTAFLALMHFTHLGLLAVVLMTSLTFSLFARVPWAEIAKRASLGTIAIVFVGCAHLLSNGYFLHRWAISPAGPWFLFARVNEDGLIPIWLDRHCGIDAPHELCEIRSSLPQDSQVLLWSGSSPLHAHIHEKIGTPEYWHWMDMLEAAAMGSIREQPVRFAEASVSQSLKQFIHFAALDDLCPKSCATPTLVAFRPDVGPDLQASRQLRDQMPRNAVREATGAFETLALLLLIPFFAAAIRRQDRAAQSILGTVIVSLFANAFLAGALSAVNDRYQSRVEWLPLFVELVILFRWYRLSIITSHPGLSKAKGSNLSLNRPLV